MNSVIDDLAWLIGYFFLIGCGLVAGGYVLLSIPIALKTIGIRGSIGIIFGLMGWGWGGYALTHREEITSLGLVIGMLVPWGIMIFILTTWKPSKKN